MEQLSRQKCEACRRGAPRLTDEELAALYAQIPAWSVVERDGIKRLERMVKTPDFASAMELAQRIGALAEAEGHHPALLVEWGRLTISWWTHKIGGLHRNDAIMAARSDEIIAA
jgi:4a-hydroxytetrahydrobiopterin dehydratase